MNHFDAGPVRLVSIVHAFDYRVAVLRDGAKPALRTARSRKAERGFLVDVSLPWGQEVAVMFQILCAFVLDVLAAAECLTYFHGVSPDVLLAFEPWGHVDHTGVACGCCSSDRTGAYVHEIAFNPPTSICEPTASSPHQAPSKYWHVLPGRDTTGVTGPTSCDGVPSVRPGSVPFISDRAGAYGRLLLATHERMLTGGLAACDWLTSVTRGGGGAWRALLQSASWSTLTQAD